MNIFRSLIIIMIAASALQMFAMQPLEVEPLDITQEPGAIINQLGIRALIILFDPNNKDIHQVDVSWDRRAFKDAFLSALHNSVPIITNYWFLDFLKNNDIAKYVLSNWDIYSSPNIAIKDPKTQKRFQAQAMLIFIPKKDNPIVFKQLYLIEYHKHLDSYTIDKENQISDGEILLGIRIKNLKKIDPLKNFSEDPHKPTENLRASLQDILITRSALRKAKLSDDYLNRWDIYIQGHSEWGTTIAGIPVTPISPNRPENFFSLFLDFLNLDLNTRSLFYMTCFSGGENLVKPYQVKDLNFMIISANTFVTPISTLGIYTSNNFDTYFNKLNLYITKKDDETGKVPALASIVGNLYNWESSLLEDIEASLQLPTARLPHTDWFNVIDTNAQVFRITDSLIQRIIQTKKPEDRRIAIPASVTLLLIESRYIPIPIDIQEDKNKSWKDQKLPLIIPLEINKDYYFEELNAPQAYIAERQHKDLSLINKMEILTKKIPNTGRFFIKKMIMKLGHDRLRTEYGTTTLKLKNVFDANVFENMIIDPAEKINIKGTEYINPQILAECTMRNNTKRQLCYEDYPFYWRSLTDEEQERFDAQSASIAKIRNASKLPESMKSENPKPMFEITPSTGPKPTIKSNAPQEPKSS